jgi:hypothetical protein
MWGQPWNLLISLQMSLKGDDGSLKRGLQKQSILCSLNTRLESLRNTISPVLKKDKIQNLYNK